jgi:hypothetical protein
LCIVSRSGKGLGNHKAIHKASIVQNLYIGKGRNNGRSKLATVRCLGEDNVFVCIKDDQGVSIVFSLSTRNKVVGIKGSSLGHNNNCFSILVSRVLRIECEIFKVIKVNDCIQGHSFHLAPIPIDIDSTVNGIEIAHACHHDVIIWFWIPQISTNGQSCVYTVSRNGSILFGNDTEFIGILGQSTFVR